MSAASAIDLQAIALEKMSRVLGPSRAKSLMAEIQEEKQLELRSADELFEFGRALTAMGGFEGAVGSILTFKAVLLGASRGHADR